MSKSKRPMAVLSRVLAGAAGVLVSLAAIGAWEPEKPVELIVPGAAGSDVDQRARLVQEIIVKYNLMKQPLLVVNKSGGAGAEGFLALKNSPHDAHRLLVADNKIFTVPLASGVPFNWKETTPVAMLALEQFVLWTNAKSSYKSARDYIGAAKTAGRDQLKMGGTGAHWSDQVLTVAMEWETDSKFTYVPYRSGAEAADQLAVQNVASTVSNPSEARDLWRAGRLTPHCVFDNVRMPYTGKVTASQSWGDIPTCREAGIPVDYQALYGIFMSPGVSPDQASYFFEVFRRVVVSPEWTGYMESGAFKQTFKTGSVFVDWLSAVEKFHRQFLVPSRGPRPARQEWPIH